MTCRIRLEAVSKEFDRPHRWMLPSFLVGSSRRGPRNANATIRALREVTLSIDEGERVGVIGSNGAGKSTLLRLIAGLATPSSGSIGIEGSVEAVLTLGAVLREDATGRENVRIDGEMKGRRPAEIAAQIDDAIVFSELVDFFDRPVRTYSSGMKGRLAFAMIASNCPEILLIDEALSVGDAHFARKATQRMRELADGGRIVVVVSHGMQAIVEMCSRCLWLEDGRLKMDGDPAAVVDAYVAHVNEIDDRSLRKKFMVEAVRAGRAGAEVRDVVALRDGRRVAIVTCGEALTLRATGDASALESPGLTLRLVRIDGTVIAEQVMPQEVGLRGAFSVDVDLPSFVLGPNAYRAEFWLTEGGSRAAGASAVFEVRAAAPLIGGVPMLSYRARIDVVRQGTELS